MWKCMAGLGIRTRDLCISTCSKVLPMSYTGQLISMVLQGQTTTFLPLQSVYSLRNSQQTHVYPSGHIGLTN